MTPYGRSVYAVNNSVEGPVPSSANSDMDDVALTKKGSKNDPNTNKVYPATDCDDKNFSQQRIGPMSEDEQFSEKAKLGKVFAQMKNDDPLVTPGASNYETNNPNQKLGSLPSMDTNNSSQMMYM